MSTGPAWSAVIDPEARRWKWEGRTLVHEDALADPYVPPRASAARKFLLQNVYAVHNAAKNVRRNLDRLLGALPPGEWGANVGGGERRLHPRVLNVDLFRADGVDIVTRGQALPFRSESLALVISQEVLEHLEDPQATVDEVHRVLRPGGSFYCQVPFIIGQHAGPHDYWRFTREGVERLFDPERWRIETIETSVGHGTGFYRIAVEFFAVNASAVHRSLYLPAKAASAILLMPLRLADRLTDRVGEVDRIPGGYLCVATKRAERAPGPRGSRLAGSGASGSDERHG